MTASSVVRTVASNPQVCTVCAGSRVVHLVSLLGWPVQGYLTCPHCSTPHLGSLPIHHYRPYTDQPRGGAA